MMELSWTVPSFLMIFVSLFPGASEAFLAGHANPAAFQAEESSGWESTAPEASVYALLRFHLLGVEDPVVLSVKRIEAPLSGYLVDASGRLELEGRAYSLFRLGLRDDGENSGPAWSEFVFLAAGFGEDGEPFIYPAGDPGSDDSFAWQHEFLLDREDFLALRRYAAE